MVFINGVASRVSYKKFGTLNKTGWAHSKS